MWRNSLWALTTLAVTVFTGGAAQAFSLSTSGVWSSAVDSFGGNAIGGQGTNKISWGSGGLNSSYTFNGINPAQEKTESELTIPFLLGTFTHNNFPIFYPSLANATLTVGFALDEVVSTFSFLFKHEETSNDPATCSPESVSVCDDIVGFPSATSTETIRLDGVEYNLTLIGFSQNNGVTLVDRFLTQEQKSNQAGLYAQLTPVAVDEPVVAVDESVPEPFSLVAAGVALGAGTMFKKSRK